ncbi:hypothetical protein BDW42DRAFT_168101 [Aspergillus taichungensis]|uniref:Uncharacterized protein n=1 Tax=Aspergillus taichungensis TaxID=482145 RepID=A0A2J5HWJ8_9EURO|nr:hypothetical protein BDW42DRAFT_168101 [Aspergillus taichungensis]
MPLSLSSALGFTIADEQPVADRCNLRIYNVENPLIYPTVRSVMSFFFFTFTWFPSFFFTLLLIGVVT